MPQIPVYESQASAGPVPKTPEATADDFGAMTSKAIVGATQAGLDLAGKVIEARHAAETSRGAAEAAEWFRKSSEDAGKDQDPATTPARYEKLVADQRAKYQAMGRGAFRDGALHVFDTLGRTSVAQVRNNAAKREIALHQSDLKTDADFYIGQAAGASNDLERQIYVNLFKTSVARANAAGYIGKDDALERLRALPGRIEEKRVEGLIERDPAAAVAALDDKRRFPNLDSAQSDLLRGKAALAQQKASFVTVSAVQQGIADGTKTQHDVDRLFEDGAIGQATRDWLAEQVKKATKERAEKADGQKRVDAVLRDGGKLDPKKPKDQAAVDAHYDAVVAPANPSAATLVGYAARTGMVPTTLGRRIRGGLASDDPQQVVNAASLIQELGKSDGKLAEGFGAKRRRFAKSVMDGVDGGLAPERAVELATKRLGQPDASGDEGTQIADAEAGSAGGGETANSAETKNDDATANDDKDTDAPDLEIRPEPGGGYGVYAKGALAGWSQTEEGAREILARYRAELQSQTQPSEKTSGEGEAGESSGGAKAEPDAAAEPRVRRSSPKGREVVGPPPDVLGDIGDVASDIGHGLIEAPGQILGGAADAVRETFKAFDHLANWLNEHVADLSIDPDSAVGRLGNPLTSIAEAMPEVAKAQTVTGGVVRGVAQFLAGFVAGGKIARVLRVPTKAGRAMAAGAFADAIARDPAERNLANLIEEHAELKIPVLEYLVARDDDSEAEARFKKALEGLLLGPLSDAAMRPLIEGLGLAVKAIKARRRALRESGVPDDEFRRAEREQLARAYDEVRAQPHGPVNDPIVRIRPEGLDEILVERGPAFERDGQIVVRGRELQRLFGTNEGFGLVKIIWRHGEESNMAPMLRVGRDDVIAFPSIVRDFEPARIVGAPGADRYTREYRVERDGRTIVYIVTRFTAKDGLDHLITIYVQEPGKRGAESALSRRKKAK